LVNIYDSEKAFGANLFCLLAKTTPTLSKDTYIRHYLLNEEQQGQPQNIEKSALLTSSTATIPPPHSFSKPPTSNNPSSNSSINSKASLLPNFLSKTSLDKEKSSQSSSTTVTSKITSSTSSNSVNNPVSKSILSPASYLPSFTTSSTPNSFRLLLITSLNLVIFHLHSEGEKATKEMNVNELKIERIESEGNQVCKYAK